MSFSYIKRAEEGNNSALSYIVTLILCIGVLITGQTLPIYLAILIKNGGDFKALTGLSSIDKIMGFFPYHISFSLLMMGFVLLIICLWFCIRFIHRRKFGTIWSDTDKFRYADFFKGLIISIVLFILSDVIVHFTDPTYHKWVFDPSKFWIYLPFALLFIPFQTLSEELFFRGYIYQTAGLATRNKWIALVISAVIFGMCHFGNQEMSLGFGKMAFIYIGSGLMIGLSVVISRGIEFGWGFHLVNNLYLSTLTTFKGSSLDGPTLYEVPKPTGDRMLIEFCIQFLVFAAILLVVYRKNIKSLLNPNA